MKKHVLIFYILFSFTFVACNQNGRIVTETPIKTNILGVELCKKMTSNEVGDLLTKNTDRYFLAMPEKNGNLEFYRSFPMGMNFSYGGLSWSYVDVAITKEKEVYLINIVGSYESVESANLQYDSAVAMFTEKYGKGNTEGDGNIYWTDDVNSVGLRYYASSALDGSDRSFCELYYVNIRLSEIVEEENQPDI